MTGEVAIITGGGRGLGKAFAIALADKGMHVVVTSRSESELQNTVQMIKDRGGEASYFTADVTDQKETQQIIATVEAQIGPIDLLINNAGIFKTNSPLNDNGLDIRFVVNYLAPYLLTRELLPLLESGSNSRLINLSSAAQASVSLTALTGKDQLTDQEAYAQSKLALTAWSFAMAQEYEELTTIAVNPGSLLNTKMVQEAYGHHWSAAEKGSDLLVALATSAEFDQSSGQYFDNDKGGFGPAHPEAYEAEKNRVLLAVTNELIPTA